MAISSMVDRDTVGKAAAISGTRPVTAFSEADTRQVDSRAIFKIRFLFWLMGISPVLISVTIILLSLKNIKYTFYILLHTL